MAATVPSSVTKTQATNLFSSPVREPSFLDSRLIPRSRKPQIPHLHGMLKQATKASVFPVIRAQSSPAPGMFSDPPLSKSIEIFDFLMEIWYGCLEFYWFSIWVAPRIRSRGQILQNRSDFKVRGTIKSVFVTWVLFLRMSIFFLGHLCDVLSDFCRWNWCNKGHGEFNTFRR